ncbi:sporulation protein [Actinomadura viridis]|uniref:sporulation protein n=1 Tax=Actinomadura viridis TaxID=58110 RepID=UPI0036918A74
MAFRKLLSSLGIDGPQVQTVLDSATVRPGEKLQATVTIVGGASDVRIDELAVELVTRVEDYETSKIGWANPGVVVDEAVAPFNLAAREHLKHQISLHVPWEMPLTHAHGQPLRGARAAVRTVLAIDSAVDRGDFDEVDVHALPSQELIIQAFQSLGFRLDEAEVKAGYAMGAEKLQTLPYWQELEFFCPAEYAGRLSQVETQFVARADSLDLFIGEDGPHTFTHADLAPDTFMQWLDAHCRTLWR